jgi:large subunit ribosomal protein L29
MEIKDLRERTSQDLAELKVSLTRELFKNRMKNAVGQLEDTSILGKAKKDIARIQTILSERAQAASGEA